MIAVACRSSLAPAQRPVLRRACACGGTPDRSGECPACRMRRLSRLAAAGARAPEQTAPTVVHDVLRSPGSPLGEPTRAFMESRLGHDFGRVRVHADGRASESARAVGALAYTVGSDVVFAAGRYEPESERGRSLLAHELAHVVQQSGAAPAAEGALRIGAPNAAEEREADAAAGGAEMTVQPAQVLRRQPSSPPGMESRSDVGDLLLRVNEDGQVEILYGAPKVPVLGHPGFGFRCSGGKCVPVGVVDPVDVDKPTYTLDEALAKLRNVGGGATGTKTPSLPGRGRPGLPPIRICLPDQVTPTGLCCQPGETWDPLERKCGPRRPPPVPPLTLGTGTGGGLRRPRFGDPGLGGPRLELGLPEVEVIDHFSVDGDTVPDTAAAVLDRLAPMLARATGDIYVTGHTDSTFTKEHNLGLSRRRADSVVRALVARGVDAARLHADGRGETQLLFPAERTDEEKARNRRVQVSFRAPLRGLDPSPFQISPELRLSLEPLR